jgi:hypothetical protein
VPSESGAAGQAGAAGAAGSAGTASVVDKDPGSIDEFGDLSCRRTLDCVTNSNAYDCPESPESIIATLCALTPSYGGTYTRLDSICGGTIISAEYGTHAQTWSFDTSNHLTGGTYREDSPLTCPDGSQSHTSVTGEVCAPQGEPQLLCSPGGS